MHVLCKHHLAVNLGIDVTWKLMMSSATLSGTCCSKRHLVPSILQKNKHKRVSVLDDCVVYKKWCLAHVFIWCISVSRVKNVKKRLAQKKRNNLKIACLLCLSLYFQNSIEGIMPKDVQERTKHKYCARIVIFR